MVHRSFLILQLRIYVIQTNISMKSSNPALNNTSFNSAKDAGIYNDIMTLEGTVTKSIYLLGIVLTAGVVGWKVARNPAFSEYAMSLLTGGAILAFIVAMVTIFKKEMSPTTAPAYAILEGLSLGVLSYVYEQQYAGIVLQSILLTVAVFVALLFCYKSGIIKPTENFKLGIVSATMGVLILYILNFIGGFIGWQLPYLHESGPIGIGVSLVIIVIAALNLVIDFDFIEQGAERSLPKYMEWYGAFGLLITLVWLYIEILRLLAKLHDRN